MVHRQRQNPGRGRRRCHRGPVSVKFSRFGMLMKVTAPPIWSASAAGDLLGRLGFLVGAARRNTNNNVNFAGDLCTLEREREREMLESRKIWPKKKISYGGFSSPFLFRLPSDSGTTLAAAAAAVVQTG